MELLTKHLPSGTLSLPTPPEGLRWVIENSIVEGKNRNKYFIEIKLVHTEDISNESTPVIKVREQWNKKVEPSYIDFALGATGLALLELDSYLGFKAINWHNDNPEMIIKIDTPTKTVWVS